ncbi:hypothetical protein ACNKHR_04300 [Shigella flexneri]
MRDSGGQRRQIPATARVTFSGTFTGRSASAEILRPKPNSSRAGIPPAGYGTCRRASYRLSPCAGGFVAGDRVIRMDDELPDFIFMRRLGSAALTATGTGAQEFCRWVFILRRKKRCRNWQPDWLTTENASSSTLRCHNCP